MQDAFAVSSGTPVSPEEAHYAPPREAAVQNKLSWFQDQKLALMVHFGVYSQLGICESWPLSDGDADWARKNYLWERDPDAFRKSYFDLNRSFNPIRLNPDEWARQAEEAGMKYLILTTKHHDGFCLYDTKQTDYRSTGADCPFSAHRYANIAKAIFDAFRARGLGIAAYYSKPDWHCPWYWAKGMEKPVGADRNPTYSPDQRPEVWNEFVRFTHAQMEELARDLGPLDILWLDGGQVRPDNGQDIRMAEIAQKLRKMTPDLIFADRTVGGEFENYITPEQAIPKQPILVPWESCLTIGRGFAYSYDDDYKSPRALARLLIEVVCKGGNLALGVGAQPDGRLPRKAMESAKGLGNWLRTCGEAIYETRPLPPYISGAWAGGEGPDIGYTMGPNGLYALLPLPENEPVPKKILLPFPAKSALLLNDYRPLPLQNENGQASVALPERLLAKPPIALAIRLEV